MFCDSKSLSLTVAAELVRVKATLDKGLSLLSGAQGCLVISAVGCCSCEGLGKGKEKQLV